MSNAYLSVLEIRELLPQGLTIGSCAELILDGKIVGYPASHNINPDRGGYREVWEDNGDSVLIPCVQFGETNGN